MKFLKMASCLETACFLASASTLLERRLTLTKTNANEDYEVYS